MSTVFDDLSFNNLLPYVQWQTLKFPGGASFAESGAEDDPDKDGLINLIEYAFGSEPMLPNPSPAVSGTTTVGGETFHTLTVPKNPDATDSVVSVEAASSLTASDWSANGLVIVTDSATLLTVRDSQPMSAQSRRFFRARVTR